MDEQVMRVDITRGVTALTYLLFFVLTMLIFTLFYADLYRVRGAWWPTLILTKLLIGIYRDPGEGRGQRLAGGGQPA